MIRLDQDNKAQSILSNNDIVKKWREEYRSRFHGVDGYHVGEWTLAFGCSRASFQ